MIITSDFVKSGKNRINNKGGITFQREAKMNSNNNKKNHMKREVDDTEGSTAKQQRGPHHTHI